MEHFISDEEPPTKRNPLAPALIAAASALIIIAALYLAPWIVGAFLAGVLMAVWFT